MLEDSDPIVRHRTFALNFAVWKTWLFMLGSHWKGNGRPFVKKGVDHQCVFGQTYRPVSISERGASRFFLLCTPLMNLGNPFHFGAALS